MVIAVATTGAWELVAALVAGSAVGLLAWGLLGHRSNLERYAEILDAHEGTQVAKPKVALTERIELELSRAGWVFTPRELIGMWVGISFAISVVFALLSKRIGPSVLVGPIVTAAGLYWGAKISQVRRGKLLDEQLIRVLFTLSGMIQAGRRPDSALEEAAKTVGPPLGPELHWVVRQYRVGVELTKALRMAADRIGSQEFTYFVVALEVNAEKGGDIVNILGKLAGSVSTHISLRGERRSSLAEVQMTRHIASFAPFAMAFMVWIASPSTFDLLVSTGTGIQLLGLAIVSWIFGFVILSRMVRGLEEQL